MTPQSGKLDITHTWVKTDRSRSSALLFPMIISSGHTRPLKNNLQNLHGRLSDAALLWHCDEADLAIDD